MKQIERNELAADDFMQGIGDYIRTMIRNSADQRLDHRRWGNCPLCGQEVIRGKRAFGCSAWKDGCAYVLEPEHKGLTLSNLQIRTLLQQHILPHPLQVANEPRIFVLSTQGVPMDLRLPSAERQNNEKPR
ncbi:MAG: hypothetical protein QNL91_14800 [Candidatus Krumholzibacteria bacterium]|nr:hypothetical protein [Candidatus Krumholzibacteria bacterium]